MRTLAIAALQTAPLPWDPTATAAAFTDDVLAVRETFPQTQLVLAPELHLMAVGPPLEEHRGYAEKVAVALDGSLVHDLRRLARQTGLWLVPGSVYERGDDGLVYNTALALSPEGELVARYRKCFPWQPYETSEP